MPGQTRIRVSLKPCLDCGDLSDQSRCPTHRTSQEQVRGSAAARGYDAGWRRLVKEAVRLHLQKYGAVCPGYGVPPHTATKASLTGDHKIPLSLGGKNEASNIQVLCRPCNSRKGGRNRDGSDSTSKPAETPVKRSFLIYEYDRPLP